MKKRLSCALILALTTGLLISCGSKDGSVSNAGGNGAAGSAKEIVLGHVYAEDHNINRASLQFKDYIEKESGGSMTVNIQPNSVLGGDEDMLEMCAYGTVTLMTPSVASLETYAADWGVLNLPYLYDSVEDAFEAADGELGDYLKSTLDGTEYICVGFNSNGTRNMSNNVRPITCIEDLKGIKMRVMNSSTYIKWMNALGANATPMGFNEVFTGLQQGTIDGQENGAAIAYTSGFNEVQKYFSVTEHVYDMNAIICNRAFYESLTDEEREIFDTGIRTYMEDWQRNTEVSEDGEYIAKWEESGCAVNYLEDDKKEAFREALTPLYEEAEANFPEAWEALSKYR
ncbi:TRAP transporter substrate-binding protein [Lawsonibacter sp. OA9]|uniref:TRAP transporter substrate-binding protein n=1 Tax=Flintibacter hominis TaxID=2763048 RepID=A0A8J6J1I3_9FIRM|nr:MULTISPECIES: TRAP transporter substrate-binding protein [Eubacteriales]SCH80948.1 C4-dicarboxylate-binding periplasmic protein precursor [uncultured Clostridium sp.]SCJ32715.1 C4-dicarboxylate-binding periplasmic protein precursor [uncultured Flavonifractor sp.]MBC5723826.1 TRAP transporter substrate-binding protein [Flintibacter hominis]MCH1979436.1 TRAP transporter substrate-binding protein [Lawsonibacter sp. OA9]MCU6703037.1 TRAP transporter substrate-binding protein [Muriventricola ace